MKHAVARAALAARVGGRVDPAYTLISTIEQLTLTRYAPEQRERAL